MTNLLLETAKDNLAYTQNTFIMALGNRRAFCMRMRQFGLLKCHRGIFCELFTFSTSICRLFSGAEWRVLGATFHKRVLQRIVVFFTMKVSLF